MKCRAAIYCRLSKEDMDKHDPREFSQSIKNQEAMLIQYAKEQDFRIVKIYRDDDYSGLYDDRPGFERLIADAKEGCFDIVIAKTQSRFTRNMEHLEKYLHHEFIQWGIRFIGTVDHVDTAVKGNKKARQINGLVNEWYCEDLSESVRASFRIKQMKGEYLASAPPYGYVKDPQDHHRLIPDPYAAEIVRRIFSLYLSGIGKAKIARILTTEGVLRPSVYKRKTLGLNYHNAHEVESTKAWSFQTITDILKNEVYLGHTIQNKYVKISYKSKHKKNQPPEEWIRVEHTHEPIIDETTFQMAREMKKRKAVPVDATPNRTLFWKKLRCADCGRSMTKYYSRKKKDQDGSRKTIYICRTYKAHGNSICNSHSISEEALKALVLEAIHQEGHRLLDEEKIQRLRKIELYDRKNELEARIGNLCERLEKTQKYQERIYEDFADEVLTRDEFLRFKKKYEKQERQIQGQIDDLQAKKDKAETGRHGPLIEWVDKFRNYMEIEELNREVVEELIEKIVIHGGKEIDVHFKFSTNCPSEAGSVGEKGGADSAFAVS